MGKVQLIRKDALKETMATPGIARKEAFASEGIWVGAATTEAHMSSGWHHHGDHVSYIYVQAGRFRLQSGAGGKETVEAGPGDFLKIPTRTVHRESNPFEEEAFAIVVRVGTGPVVVNVDGPEP